MSTEVEALRGEIAMLTHDRDTWVRLYERDTATTRSLRDIAAAGWDLRNAIEEERLAWVTIGQLDPPDVAAARRVEAAFSALTSLVVDAAVFPLADKPGSRDQEEGT